MDDKLLNWEDGTQGAFNRCSIPRICAAPPTWGRISIEAPGWGRAQAPAMNRALIDPGLAARQRFMRMSNSDKLFVALRQFALRLPKEARHHAKVLVDPANLAIMAGALAIWVGAQATPVGWVVDIAMFGMGVVAIGSEAIDVAREFRDFAVGVLGAEDESELRAAVDHLAKAMAIVGVDVVVALLLKKATVKVREPKMPVPGGGDSKLLFGKYDPKMAQRRLPPEKAKPVAELPKVPIKAASGGESSQAAIRARVETNVAKSAAARASSNFNAPKSGLPDREWPPFPGSVNQIEHDIVLQPGTRIDRFGAPQGTFLSPAGTSYSARALKPGTMADDYYVYEVLRPLPVKAGEVRPWFGESGGGTQYRLDAIDGVRRSPSTLTSGENPYLREVFKGKFGAYE